jgi:hypothetical protein
LTLKRISAVLMACVVTATAMLGSAGSASAAGISRAALATAADAVEYENVGGSLYGHFRGAAGYSTQLNWGSDGCSIPAGALVVAGIISPVTLAAMVKYRAIFEQSCVRHDFGYRNYGRNTSTSGPHLGLDPTHTRKNSIDARFKSNMNLQCDRAYGFPYVSRTACKLAAEGFYLAVDKTPQGHRAFFG